MAVGGYTATYLTVYHGRQIAALVGSTLADAARRVGRDGARACSPARPRPRSPASLVGIPSLRLKGDYLAIVTLGFGEIIRVLILNIPAVGGATGFTDAIPITNFFWIFAMAVLTIVIVRNIAASTFGRALAADPRRRDRRRGDGHQHDALQGAGVRHQRRARRRRRRPVGPALRESAESAEPQLREVDRGRS